ncbi:GNAT family N-acetyltransferase [Halobacterium hubeiense]|uniref:GNAT family N-acetyltransferase n=1 Tax=Halobacterium hubeiense TaxID=1407499 RepID=UPI000B7D8C65|nr:GNAT family N-acetyltransferase [Halobacterium hubeiense]
MDPGTLERPKCTSWDNSNCEGTPLCPPRCPRFVDKNGVPILVRRSEAEDFEDIVEMYQKLDSTSRAMGLPPNGEDALRGWLRALTDNGWSMVAFEDDMVVGHVGVSPATTSDPEFVIFVLDDYQNRGIGTELVKHTIAWAGSFSHDALTLEVMKKNRPALTVYQNVGFEVSDQQGMSLTLRLSLQELVAEQVQRPPAER